MDFMDLGKTYDRVYREALCQVPRMYDVGGKLLNGVKSIYTNSLACFRVKWDESECFRIDRSVIQGCIMSHYDLQCIYGRSDEGGGNGEEGREISRAAKRVEIA